MATACKQKRECFDEIEEGDGDDRGDRPSRRMIPCKLCDIKLANGGGKVI